VLGTVINPADDRVDLRLAQASIVHELVVARISVPRRHLTAGDRFADGLRPRPGFFVGHEGHGCDLTGPMTVLVLTLQDGLDVLGERDVVSRCDAYAERDRHEHEKR